MPAASQFKVDFAMNWRDSITIAPAVCHGKACIKGTRIMVSVVLDNLAAGFSPEEIVENYPSLSAMAVEASLAYAAELAHNRAVLPIYRVV